VISKSDISKFSLLVSAIFNISNLFFDEDIILPFFAGEMFAGTNINLSKFSDSIIVWAISRWPI
jgi:hypothetical protein